MQFRTKLFITSGVVVLLLWAGSLYPIQRLIASNFDQLANDDFNGTRRSLASSQVEQINNLRRAGSLVMNIPELRALIAEHNYEVSADNLASLQERLDNMAGIVGSRFICVLDSRASLIAQNSASPWPTVPALRQFISDSPQAAPFVNRLFTPRYGASQDSSATYSLWVHAGKIYQVVGLPLLFSNEAGEVSRPDGALVMASPITQEFATNLGASHNCEITFLTTDSVAASSLDVSIQAAVLDAQLHHRLPAETLFSLAVGRTDYRSYMQPLIDPASASVIGGMLIQSSREAGAALERRISLSLLSIMSAGLFLAALVSFILSGAITQPVRKLLLGVRRVADGDLESSIDVNRHDEIGELAAAFNDMVVQLRNRHQLERMVDESQAATKAKSQFLANMSHEIRTPLNGVIGMANVLLSTELDDRQRHYAELVKSSAEVLTTLINDILDFSKIEAGKLELESAEFDLRAVVEDVVELLAQKAFAKGVEIACNLDNDLPRSARGDANRLRQVLMNLIGNAVKFTERGEIIVRASVAGPRDSGGMLVCFAVIDSGPGIPADRMERLFKSFSQVDTSTTRRYGGTGLGLAISKQLAELMGGKIGVESDLGEGSTFWFTVALEPVDRSLTAPPTELAGIRALVVHKSPAIQAILRQELAHAGLLARSVSTRTEAETLLANGTGEVFSIALIDRVATDMKNLPLPESSRQLILTSPADDLPAHRLRSLGFAGSIIKPVRVADLIETLAAVLSPDFSGPADTKTLEADAATKPAEKPYRILLAEDNPVNQIVASELLTRAGYGVAVVSHGEEAVRAYRDGAYDLVLMDCQMPIMDGLEATRAIRLAEEAAQQSGASGRRVPIVALTANASNVDRARCLEAGMDGYFQKPFKPRELLETVTRYLGSAGESSVLPDQSPPEPSSDSTIPIDKNKLMESCSDSTALARSILEQFEKQVNAALSELSRYIDEQNAAELARLAHTLKGTAGIIGAKPLCISFSKLEELGRSGVLDSADKELERLRGEINDCSAAAIAMQKELAGQPVT